MDKDALLHLLRACAEITEEDRFFVFGSQSILAKFPNPPKELSVSMEADIAVKAKAKDEAEYLTQKLETNGLDSDFHVTFGYYIDPVDLKTATLPAGWEGRLVNLESHHSKGVAIGLCLDPHDLVLSKYFAGRSKDYAYNQVVVQYRMVHVDRLMALLVKMPISSADKDRIAHYIELHFALPELKLPKQDVQAEVIPVKHPSKK